MLVVCDSAFYHDVRRSGYGVKGCKYKRGIIVKASLEEELAYGKE
jgi:hypothetical protein